MPQLHTPEPWVVRERFHIGVEGDCWSLADVKSCHVAPPDKPEIAEANARRIVACVNCLAGIPTEYLEKLKPGALADLIEGWLAAGGD